MRKQKTIKIDNKEIIVRELRVQDILDIFDQVDRIDLDFVSKHLAHVTPDITIEDLKAMAPSEIMEIYNAFREVNTTFFELARQTGMESLLADLKKAILTDFGALVAGSLKLGTITP